MFAIKKIFFLFYFFTIISFSLSVFNSLARENELLVEEQLISQVEQLFLQSPESLHYNKVIDLSNEIIANENKYPTDIVAKTYLLLASITINKGELETAFQFIQDGLAITTPNQQNYLYLQLKLAEIFTIKKDYQNLLTAAEQTINANKADNDAKFLLFALSYRSIAYAMSFQYEKALEDIQQVQILIKQTPAFSEHIFLLSILANAYYHLDEFQTALTIQLKILKLRFNLNNLDNIDRTYYQLGNMYFSLQRYDDAYNAYWEAKKYAEKKSAPIYIAYAKQGLALTLLYQQLYPQAKIELLQAQKIFYQHNIIPSYLETLISLAQLSYETKQFSNNQQYLAEAEKVSENIALSKNYNVLYQQLAQMYLDKGDVNIAYFWQKKYSQALLKAIPIKQYASIEITKHTSVDSSKTKELTLKLAEKSELASTFTSKYQQQQIIIFILVFICISILVRKLIIWLKHRAKQSRKTYDEQENHNHTLVNPIQTKQLYQNSFKMAKKYSYPLTLGYISVSNWQELTFKFSKKIVSEVSDGIAELISDNINEFESVGLINDGEYLLFFPHQNKEEASQTMENILQALRLRFFAHLGDFSVTLSYSVESPDFQDIDPYIFLSQLSSSIKSV